jgi:hypothetical protein
MLQRLPPHLETAADNSPYGHILAIFSLRVAGKSYYTHSVPQGVDRVRASMAEAAPQGATATRSGRRISAIRCAARTQASKRAAATRPRQRAPPAAATMRRACALNVFLARWSNLP